MKCLFKLIESEIPENNISFFLYVSPIIINYIIIEYFRERNNNIILKKFIFVFYNDLIFKQKKFGFAYLIKKSCFELDHLILLHRFEDGSCSHATVIKYIKINYEKNEFNFRNKMDEYYKKIELDDDFFKIEDQQLKNSILSLLIFYIF